MRTYRPTYVNVPFGVSDATAADIYCAFSTKADSNANYVNGTGDATSTKFEIGELVYLRGALPDGQLYSSFANRDVTSMNLSGQRKILAAADNPTANRRVRVVDTRSHSHRASGI